MTDLTRLSRFSAAAVALLALSACVPSASQGMSTPGASAAPAGQISRPLNEVTVTPAPVAVTAVVTVVAPTLAPMPTPVAATPTPQPIPPTAVPQPVAPPPVPTAPPYVYGGGECNAVVHVVQRGENLFRIALRYGTTVSAIARANRIANAALIYSGQRLTINACGSVPTGKTYVVQPGDTLYRIALRFGVSVPALQLANRLSSTFIVSGQTLIIP